jgi:spore maturation protein CgeB
VVVGFERPGFGMDIAEALAEHGHEVRTFAYRRDNVLYKNRGTKTLYQRWLLGRLESLCADWRPSVVLVCKGGPIRPEVIGRIRSRYESRFVNLFPDNPLWMIPFDCIEAYDVFLTKDRYALGCLMRAGLRNVAYLPLYCVPKEHYPVTLTGDECSRFAAAVSLVGSRYPYRERLMRELAGYPVRVWGPGWPQTQDPEVRSLVAGGPVVGREKLCVYSGSILSLNPHHPMNDIVGVNIRTFELAAAGACQVVDLKDDLGALFKPGEEVVTYRTLSELRQQLDYYLAHPDEARAIGANARRRALAEHTVAHRVDEILVILRQRFGVV